MNLEKIARFVLSSLFGRLKINPIPLSIRVSFAAALQGRSLRRMVGLFVLDLLV